MESHLEVHGHKAEIEELERHPDLPVGHHRGAPVLPQLGRNLAARGVVKVRVHGLRGMQGGLYSERADFSAESMRTSNIDSK